MFCVLRLLVLTAVFSSAALAQTGITPCGTAATLSVTGTSSNVQLSACGGTVLLWNISAQEAFYNFGTLSTVTAATSNWSLPGNSSVVLNLGTNRPYLAAITATSTTTLRITQGIAVR